MFTMSGQVLARPFSGLHRHRKHTGGGNCGSKDTEDTNAEHMGMTSPRRRQRGENIEFPPLEVLWRLRRTHLKVRAQDCACSDCARWKHHWAKAAELRARERSCTSLCCHLCRMVSVQVFSPKLLWLSVVDPMVSSIDSWGDRFRVADYFSETNF
jgi:hypothetical protein